MESYMYIMKWFIIFSCIEVTDDNMLKFVFYFESKF